jgi:hypothetical protein
MAAGSDREEGSSIPGIDATRNTIVEVIQPFALEDGTESAFVRSDGETINVDIIKWVKEFVPASSGDKYVPVRDRWHGPPRFCHPVESRTLRSYQFKGYQPLHHCANQHLLPHGLPGKGQIQARNAAIAISRGT